MDKSTLRDRCATAAAALQAMLESRESLGTQTEFLQEQLVVSLVDAAKNLGSIAELGPQGLQQTAFDVGWSHSRRHNEGELLNDSRRPELISCAQARLHKHRRADSQGSTAPTREGDIIIDSMGEKSIALILPWADASFRHYHQIVELYRGLGFATVIYNCPTTSASDERAGDAAVLLKVLEDLLARGGCHVLVHAMSMNGSIVWARLVKLGHDSIALRAVRCTIFDSAPIFERAVVADTTVVDVALEDSRGAMPGILRRRAYHDNVATTAYIAGYLAGYADHVASGAALASAFRERWYIDVLYQKWPSEARRHGVPLLALYSDADQVCQKQAVQEALNVFQQQGVRITSKEFHGSSHCGHHRHFEAEYIKAVADFISEVGVHESSLSRL